MRGRCAGCAADQPLVWGLCPTCRERLNYHPVSILHRTRAENVYVAATYRDPLRQWIQRWKFGRERHLGRSFGAILADAAMTLGFYRRDFLIMPVPLHVKRRRQRGFNQSEVLAKAVAEATRLPLGDALVKTKDTRDQVGLTAVQRATNLEGAFALARPIPPVSVLLIDDILTTGSTVDACAQVLLEGGAKNVQALVLCR